MINDVDAYASFLPWCSKSEILDKGDDFIVASVEVSAAGVHKAFTTRNALKPYESISMEHVDGPFKQLKGEWTFSKLGDQGCKVELHLDFEVESGLKAMLFGMLFNKVADKLVTAFSERAEQIYGNRA